jgi:hypothetical protein
MACSHRPGRQFNPVTNFLFDYRLSQPIRALEHPKFKELIDVASRATNGVRIPGRKATRGEIKHLFKGHLTRLKAQLNVGVPLGSCSFLIILHVAGSNCPRRSQPNM